MRPFRVGLCIPTPKRSAIRLSERIYKLCQIHDIELVELDAAQNLDEYGSLDVVIHKVLDYHNEFDNHAASSKIANFVTYFADRHDVRLIDDLEWCLKFTNRKYMLDLLKSCEFRLHGLRVFFPETLEVTANTATSVNDILHAMNAHQMQFPVISKSYSAYFDVDSHHMELIFSPAHFSKMRKPILLQQFHDHDGVLYKVFVVGNKFNVCERPSIKNMTGAQHPPKHVIAFDSHRISKLGQPFIEELQEFDPNKRKWRNDDTQSERLLNYDILDEFIARVQRRTRLHLFGFDVLVDRETGDYLVIDINQFPSYEGIGEQHFGNNLVELLNSLRS